MFRIGKRFGFEAAHHLPELPDGHKCARPHGHSYTVEVRVATERELTPPGFVVDFADLAPLGAFLRETFDHRDLNEVIDVAPTSENLARLLYEWCVTNLYLPAGVTVAAVQVSETTSTFAEYGQAMTSTVRDRPLLVAEMFGPTLQGEGPSCGRQALFVRLSRCNLSCPRCDTPYTWDWERFDVVAETRRLSTSEILHWVLGHPTQRVVVTGGEPLLQQSLLVPLVTALATAGRRVEMETNGTIAPTPALTEAVDGFNVSPKLSSFAAYADAERRIHPEALRALMATGRAVFKFVAASTADLDEIADLQRRFDLWPVWVMPEGTDSGRLLAVMRDLADQVVGRGWNLSTRLT